MPQSTAALMELDTSDIAGIPELQTDWPIDNLDACETSPEPQRATGGSKYGPENLLDSQDAGELILGGHAQPEAGEIPGPPPTSPAAAADAGVGASANCVDSRRPSDEDSCATGTSVAQEKISIDSEKNNSIKNSRDENFYAFVNRRMEVRERLTAKREIVAEQSVEVHRLKERHKSAKDALKESTGELSGLEWEWEELCRLLESGEWISQDWVSEGGENPEAHSGNGDDDSESASIPATPLTSSGGSPADPASTAPLSVLGITPGRLETIEQAMVPGTSRNCATVSDLEALLRSGRLQLLKGFGPKAVDVVTDKLREWRAKNPMPVESVEQVPLVDGKYDPTAWTAGKIAAADGKIRDANPHAIVSAAEWQGNPLWVAWDAGWCQGVRDRGLNVDSVHPSVAAAVSAATESSPPTSTTEQSDQEQPEHEQEPAQDQEQPVKPKRPRKKKEADQASLFTAESGNTSTALTDAYNAGCEAALANQPVSSNPYKRGTELWQAFDRGWQETFQGDELE